MSEADDLGTLVLGLAERCLDEYQRKPFPEDRDPIVRYFTLLDNLLDASDSPGHFIQGVPMMRPIAREQAKYFLAQESAQRAGVRPFGWPLATAAGAVAAISLGILAQNMPLVYGGATGLIVGCSGLAYAAAPRTRKAPSGVLARHGDLLDTGDIFWISAFREYAPEIRCLVERFKKEYAQERAI